MRVSEELGCLAYMVALIVMVLIGWGYEGLSCSAKFSGADDVVATSWGPIKGCQVNVRGKGFVPAANYRVF